jgi:hypothetical protein
MAANPWVTEIMVNEVGVAENSDAVAIAPYFGGALGDEQNASITRTMNLTQVFGVLETSMNASVQDVQAHRVLTERHGLMLVAYEGGQHLVGLGTHVNDPELHALFLSVNRDPRLQRLYTRYLQAWREAGGTLFMHYLDVAAPSMHGTWGARESLESHGAPSPKWNALKTFAESTPVWWGG